MKRQSSSSNKSILHFFKGVPRTSQESSLAPANTSVDNVSRPLASTGLAQPSAVAPSVSFGSTDSVMTSLQSLPPSASQASSASGASKRVLSRGHQVVLNSDSDSDSFGELDFGVPAPKPKAPIYTGRPTRRTTTLDEPGLRKPSKSARGNTKRTFNQLLETAQENLDTERKIKERKADLDQVDEQSAPVQQTRLDKETLKHAIQDGGDPDQADRLLKAMQRTNEPQALTAYHFFVNKPSSHMISPFPQRSLPAHGWTACFETPSTRDQAFMTGFALSVFRLQALPKELATWMIDQIYLGRNAALDQRYINILQIHEDQLQKQLSPEKLDAMFRSIGAQVDSLDADAEICPSQSQADDARTVPLSLKRIAALLTSAAPWLHTKTRVRALHLLCHTCLDDRVLLDMDALDAIRDAIEAVICQNADNRKLISGVGNPPPEDMHSLITSQLTSIIPKLLSSITNPMLQANLIHAFPSRSPLTAYLQRHLALSFLLHPHPVNIPLADPQIPALIHEYLDTSSHWHMNKDTSYSFVAARLALLDIAIGPGPATVPYIPLVSPPPSEAGSSPPSAPTPASSEVTQFNKEVDALAQQIKLLGNSIVETGASLDLTILQAKERCERVFWRLQHAVRIGGKRAENVFGDSERNQLKVRKFFKPIPKRSVAKESIFEEDDDPDVSS